ncbi:MAG: flippase [Patescibacteria group bacterium]
MNRLKNLLFGNRGAKQMVVKNFAWLSIGNLGSRFLKVFITLYIARRLGAESYGIFSYALGLASFFVFFRNTGIDVILTREVAKKREDEHSFFSTAFWIEIGLLLITVLLVLFVAPFFSKISAATVLLPIVALIIIFDDLRDMFVAFFRGKEKMELEALVMVVANLTLVVFGFLVLRLYPTPYALTVVYAISSVSCVFIASIFLRSFVKGIVRNFNKNLIKPILRSALPIGIAGLAGTLLFNVDIVMLGWWRTAQEIGLYSAAQKTAGILTLLPVVISTAILPVFSRFVHEQKEEKIRSTTETTLGILLMIAIPLVVGGIILRQSLVGFIFGSEYILAANAFAIILISIPASYVMPIFYNLIFAFDKQVKSVGYSIVASLFNVIFSFLLIPKYGIMGAAIATAGTTILYVALMWRLARKISNFRILPRPFKALFAALVMGIVVFLLQWMSVPILINIAISAGIYFLLLHLLKEKMIEEVFSLLRASQSPV